MARDLPSAASPETSVLAIGLMSGTSQDGVDVALIDTDGEGSPVRRDRLPLLHQSRTDAASHRHCRRGELDRAHGAAGIVAQAEQLVNDAHAEAVETFLGGYDLQVPQRGRVGTRGQTLLHRPERQLTLQISDGAALAARLGIPVVYDFRAADVAAGGQGAPLAPIYHRALAQRLGLAPPIAVLNIGGVANVTYIDGEDLIACDTGPGNALLDDFLRLRTGRPLDTDGRAAAAGAIDAAMIERLLAHPFFALPPPKSLDRNYFRGFVGSTLDGIGVEDGAATLTALTAAAVARIVPHLPSVPATWIVAGGGARNPTLMRMLAERLKPARIEIRRRGRLVDPFLGGAGLCLSRRAQPARPADHVSRHHRRAAPADRRCAGEAVVGKVAAVQSGRMSRDLPWSN